MRMLLAAIALFACAAACANAAEVRVIYLRAPESKVRLSLIDIPANDDGLAGARLAIEDNNTTGRFLDQQFALEDARVPPADKPALGASIEVDADVVVADLPADLLLMAADAGRVRNLLLFNVVGAIDDRLREEVRRAPPISSRFSPGLYALRTAWLTVAAHFRTGDPRHESQQPSTTCATVSRRGTAPIRRNVIHIAPTRSMLAVSPRAFRSSTRSAWIGPRPDAG